MLFCVVFHMVDVMARLDMSHSNCSRVIFTTSCYVWGHWYLTSRNFLYRAEIRCHPNETLDLVRALCHRT